MRITYHFYVIRPATQNTENKRGNKFKKIWFRFSRHFKVCGFCSDGILNYYNMFSFLCLSLLFRLLDSTSKWLIERSSRECTKSYIVWWFGPLLTWTLDIEHLFKDIRRSAEFRIPLNGFVVSLTNHVASKGVKLHFNSIHFGFNWTNIHFLNAESLTWSSYLNRWIRELHKKSAKSLDSRPQQMNENAACK